MNKGNTKANYSRFGKHLSVLLVRKMKKSVPTILEGLGIPVSNTGLLYRLYTLNWQGWAEENYLTPLKKMENALAYSRK